MTLSEYKSAPCSTVLILHPDILLTFVIWSIFYLSQTLPRRHGLNIPKNSVFMNLGRNDFWILWSCHQENDPQCLHSAHQWFGLLLCNRPLDVCLILAIGAWRVLVILEPALILCAPLLCICVFGWAKANIGCILAHIWCWFIASTWRSGFMCEYDPPRTLWVHLTVSQLPPLPSLFLKFFCFKCFIFSDLSMT